MGISLSDPSRWRLVVVACLLVTVAAACNGESTGSAPTLPASTTATTTSAEASSFPPTPPSAWETSFSSQELDEYEAALDRLKSYESQVEPIWASGRDTPAAESVFRTYFVAPVWQQFVDRLRAFEQADVRIVGAPKVLWSKARRIKIAGDGAFVSISQCVDYRSQKVTQGGVLIGAIAEPALRAITLQRVDNTAWLIMKLSEPTSESYEPCPETDS